MHLMDALSAIFSGLKAAIATHASRRDTVLLTAVWHRVHRMSQRLASLVAKWRAGTLPKPRPSQPGRKRTSVRKPQPSMPRSPAWLCAYVPPIIEAPGCAAAAGVYLRLLIENDEEAQAFLKAAPQAARILRPLMRMLSPEMPEILALPPRPRRERKPRPKKPKPPDPKRGHPSFAVPRRFHLQIPGLKKYRD